MTSMATAANSALPVGFRKKIAADFGSKALKRAAGLMFVDPNLNMLLLRRSFDEQNFGGHFALPGGGVEEGESPYDGAVREAYEEIGGGVEPDIGGDSAGDDVGGAQAREINRVQTPTGTVFHTFVVPVAKQFQPKLNGEHTGYVWTPLNRLPQPMHPAVEQTIQEQFGVAADMAPEDWDGFRDGFEKWLKEEKAEPEHALDGALTLALDRDSVRTKDKDGRLKVARTHITKANVCPYKGHEIPGFAQLGLDPDKIYHLLRDPEELRKAAPTLNGVPVLQKHIPVSAEDHQPDEVVGSIGSNAEFDGEYLDNSLYVNARAAIDGIESGAKRELSAGYHYTPDMTPGTYKGTPYDGVMRDIHFNHVALVEDGRAGPDVVVGDSMENVMPTRLAALTLQLTAGVVAPMMAMDQKVVLDKKLFADLTTKNIKDRKKTLIAGVKLATDGKLKKGLAFDDNRLAKLIDALAETGEGADESASKEQHNAMEAAANGNSELGIPQSVGEEFAEVDKGKSFNTGAVREWLAGKGMSEDDLSEFDNLSTRSLGSFNAKSANDEDDEAKKKREEDEAKKKAEEDEDPDKGKGAENMVKKPAMDEAIKIATDAVEKRVVARERGIRAAVATVEPWVGKFAPEVELAFDSAEAVYRHTLKAIGVDEADKLHADALMPVLKAQPKPGAKENVFGTPPLGMDTAAADSMKKLIGVDLDRIQSV